MHLPHEKTIKYAEKASHGLKEYKRLLKDDLLEVRRSNMRRVSATASRSSYKMLIKDDLLEVRR